MKMSYLGRFSHTGSLCPSSRSLARAMFDVAHPHIERYDEILFAGIGSGVIAQLFSALNKRVIFVDIDQDFCQRFESSLGPGQEVVCADFCSYLTRCPQHGAARLIVSCLTMHGAFRSDTLRETLLEQVEQGATVVFYTYLPRVSWVRSGRKVNGEGCRVARQATVLSNIPPAFVYAIDSRPLHVDIPRA